ncbi:hypothetical protein [Clostridium sp.]|jgi:hypothetical protein|uniref:hypothetical protein n=1 Tax=Clostridium sp. TaxID=1506 RepID=UPI003EE94F2F
MSETKRKTQVSVITCVSGYILFATLKDSKVINWEEKKLHYKPKGFICEDISIDDYISPSTVTECSCNQCKKTDHYYYK